MAIKFFNTKTGETRVVDTEPMIAAFFNSSDQHVNSRVGQDFGWKIAPETIKRIREIKSSRQEMNDLAATFQLPLDAISDTDVLRYISLQDARDAQVAEQETDYTREYEDQVRALEQENKVKADPNPSQPAGAKKKVPAKAKKHELLDDEDEPDTTVKNEGGELTAPKTDGTTSTDSAKIETSKDANSNKEN